MSHPLDVTTTARETFTHEESCKLAALIYKRFGRDLAVATAAWRRMMESNVSERAFGELVSAAIIVPVSIEELLNS